MVETQKIRYSSTELNLLKNTFSEKPELLKTIRKTLLQLPSLTEQEDKVIKTVMTPEMIKVLRKFFLPELEGDLPIHQEVDLWFTLNTEGKTPEEVELAIASRKLLMKYMDQQLKSLAGELPKEERIEFKNLTNFGENMVNNYIKIITRNEIIMHVEQQLMQIQLLAGMKDETPEQTIERLSKNSNK